MNDRTSLARTLVSLIVQMGVEDEVLSILRRREQSETVKTVIVHVQSQVLKTK